MTSESLLRHSGESLERQGYQAVIYRRRGDFSQAQSEWGLQFPVSPPPLAHPPQDVHLLAGSGVGRARTQQTPSSQVKRREISFLFRVTPDRSLSSMSEVRLQVSSD